MSGVIASGEHIPVLCKEVIDWLTAMRQKTGSQDGRYVDATVGLGGHTRAFLETLPTAEIVAIDRDPEALAVATDRLAAWRARIHFVCGRLSDVDRFVSEVGWKLVDGIIADLGVSSLQLDHAARGFSFRGSGPLDMRMDPTSGMSAARWVAHSSEKEMADVFFRYGEERHARRIARRICERRQTQPFTTTDDLAREVARAVGAGSRRSRIHPATRVFQAIRIRLNDELEELTSFMEKAPRLLANGGRLAVISYHSLEDRLVKQATRKLAGAGFHLPVRRALRPSDAEIAANPRARSAKLRIVERRV